jgi:hypothetical protein
MKAALSPIASIRLGMYVRMHAQVLIGKIKTILMFRDEGKKVSRTAFFTGHIAICAVEDFQILVWSSMQQTLV